MWPDQISNPGPLTYESGAHNHERYVDNAVLDCNQPLDCSQPPEEDLQPIFREEFGIIVAAHTKRKPAGVDNTPTELVQAGGETITDVLTEMCNKIWRMPIPMDSVADYYTP